MTKYNRDELAKILGLTVFEKGTSQYSHQLSSLKKTLPKYGLVLSEESKDEYYLYTEDSKIDYDNLFTREELSQFANRSIDPHKSFSIHKENISYLGVLKKYGFRTYTRYSIDDKGKKEWYAEKEKEFIDFLPIPNYEEYLINKEGKVYSKKTNKYLGSRQEEGYIKINLLNPKTNSWTPKGVHRLVMETFSPVEDMEEKFVDHIDGNRSNNNIDNLRWVSPHINARLCAENNKEIYDIIREYIIKNGYNQTLEKIKNALKEK